MELSYTFQKVTFQTRKNKKKSTPRKFLIFQETKTPEKLLIFSQKKAFFIFREKRTPKKFLENEDISENRTFLYFRKLLISGCNFPSSKSKKNPLRKKSLYF